MCFSPAASFTASAVLGGVGATTLMRTKDKRERLISIIPIIFAIQQFIEGLLWISLRDHPKYVLPLTGAFLFFAMLWWPLYTPYVSLFNEKDRWRKRLIILFCCAGTILAISLFYLFLLTPTPARIVNHCIYYRMNLPYPLSYAFIYVISTLMPGFISSVKRINIFTLLAAGSALVAWIMYAVNFISVWCFLAAVLSIFLYRTRNSEKKYATT